MMMLNDPKETAALAKLAGALQLAFENPAQTGEMLRKSSQLLGEIAVAEQQLFEFRKSAAAEEAAATAELKARTEAVERGQALVAARIAAREKDIETRERALADRQTFLAKSQADLDQRETDHAMAVQDHEARRSVLKTALGGSA